MENSRDKENGRDKEKGRRDEGNGQRIDQGEIEMGAQCFPMAEVYEY